MASGEAPIGRLLATGNVAEIFEWGSRVIKLYKSPSAKPAAFREAAIHAFVEALGLPVPAIWGIEQIESRWGIVFDRIAGMSLADRIRRAPDRAPDHIEHMAHLQIAIHRNIAMPLTSLKVRLASRIAETGRLERERKDELLGELAAMPDGDRLCHGDFHPLNILGNAERPVVIDWPDACRGDPAADLCRSYLLLALHARELAAPYLDAYCRLSGISRQAALAWLPLVAAAKLAENIPDEVDGLREIIDIDAQSGAEQGA